MKNKQYELELSEDAELDFDNSYLYYTEESEQIADNFFKNINSALEKIVQNPHIFQKVYKNIHRYVLLKFPFIIYYRIIDKKVQVIAIFHASRNPKIWEQRIED